MRDARHHRCFEPSEVLLKPETIPPKRVRGVDDLLEPFLSVCKPRKQWRLGTEAEKFGVFRSSGKPVPYEGPESVSTIFSTLASRFGWVGVPEFEGGPPIALEQDGASVTLEPGAQVELSGKPLTCIHSTDQEFRQHMRELRDVSAPLGIEWVGLGFHPFARRDELPWVPKLRYAVMREYLPTKGALALDMMQRTATVQVNLDFDSEHDAMRKLRVALAVQPIVTAMYANSPFVEGKAIPQRSRRAAIWLDVDPDRTGLLPFAWKTNASFFDYVNWALDVPMFMLQRGNQTIRNTGQTFRQFWKDGYEGHHATQRDWVVHLNTLFPEVRLKNTLEVRGADSVPTELIPSLPAFWKGLLYDASSLEKVSELCATLAFEDVEAARRAIVTDGLLATLAGRRVQDWALDVLRIADEGLGRIDNCNERGVDERVYLQPIVQMVECGRCPADTLLEAAQGSASFAEHVIRVAAA